jgi:hypothetical protein
MGEGECITIMRTGGGSERGRSCPASEVTLHLNMADAASSHAGSPLARSLHCIKPASHPVIGLALKLPRLLLQGAQSPLVKTPRRGGPPNRHEQAG